MGRVAHIAALEHFGGISRGGEDTHWRRVPRIGTDRSARRARPSRRTRLTYGVVAQPEYQLDHIAFGVPDLAPVSEFLFGTLGATAYGAGPGAGFRFWQWAFDGGARMEILVPAGPPDGFLHRFLASRGAAAHHVTFKVRDIHAAMERARSHGYDIVGYDDSDPGWKEAFLHPKQAQGIVVQFAEASGSSDESFGAADRFPASPEQIPAPARLVGMRLLARDEAAARLQWQTVLGGECRHTGETLEFRWPDSPLPLLVDLVPSAAEGPRTLEISADRPLVLPEGPHPLFGLPFVQVETPSDTRGKTRVETAPR